MRICVVGGGNIGTLLAAELAASGYEVTIFTSNPEKWSKDITVYDIHHKLLTKGHIQCITNDLGMALYDQDYIFVTYPSDIQEAFAKKAASYTEMGMKYVMLPGYGGTEFLMDPILQKGAVLVGFQRVHAISRLIEYGHSVCMRGRKSSLQMATYSYHDCDDQAIAEDMKGMFKLPVDILPNYLNITFTPSNPVLHTSRLYSMFKDYHEGIYYPDNIAFYDGWTDFSSEVMIALDNEVQELCRALSQLDLHYVKSLKEHYESSTVPAMTYKLTHIESFHGILSPMKNVDQGWIPDFSNRYFSDFSYGLDLLQQFAHVCKMKVPVMDQIMDWYHHVSDAHKHTIHLVQYGIQSKQDIYSKYRRAEL